MACLHDDPVTCAAMRLGMTEDEVRDNDLECSSPDHYEAELTEVDEQPEHYARLPYNCLRQEHARC